MKEVTISSDELLGTSLESSLSHQRGNRATRVPAILEVAINVFATHGNGGFTQRRIADEAGIRLRTLQHYFSTREELLRESVAKMVRRYLEGFQEIANDKSRSPESSLDAILDESISVLLDPNSVAAASSLHLWSLAEQEDFARELVRDLFGEYQEMFEGLVARMNPTLAPQECGLRAALLVSNLLGLVVYIRRSAENIPDVEKFRHATKVVFRTLCKAPQ
jgi:AcrR family transcriptional regulator